MKKVLVIATMATLSVVMAASGCYVGPSGAYTTSSYSYAGYRPYYYYGNLVYFDTVGRPYYYRSGYRVYVPSTWSYYHASVRHWRVNRVRYGRWHRRYHTRRYWRRPVRSRHYRRRVYGRRHHRRHYRTRRVRRTRRIRYRRTRRRRF